MAPAKRETLQGTADTWETFFIFCSQQVVPYVLYSNKEDEEESGQIRKYPGELLMNKLIINNSVWGSTANQAET